VGEQSGWQLTGSGPEAYERYIVPAFMATSQELVALAALQGGERVLDVACGTGIVARLAAQVVGAAGKVVGTDVNEAMLGMARTVPRQRDGPRPSSGARAMQQRFPSLMRLSTSYSVNTGSNSLPTRLRGSAR
jgi:SAM-dependent methyltransferase